MVVDPFYEVCDECGRHVVKAGHAPDCPNNDKEVDSWCGPGLPPLKDGADPWCEWCDGDLPETVYMIEGEDGGRWPPAFCHELCAKLWGNAAHQDKIYTAKRGDVVAGE